MRCGNPSQASDGLAYLLILSFLVAGLTFGLIMRDRVLTSSQPDQTPQTQIKTYQSALAMTPIVLPARLKIPRLKIDALIESAGLKADGSMDVPINPANVAWFQLGPQPGESGSAVIDGHYGSRDGTAAAFNGLHRLRMGDTISVLASDGSISSFVVRKIQNYDPAADASEVFSSNDGLSHLNLITCEGEWNSITQSYSQRLVVFSDKQ